jgi:3-oxoacyl-[acyl-carrier-protein] synthase-3
MDGQEVYKFAVRQCPKCLQEALDKAGMTVDDVDYFVLHQANVRIIESVAKRLKAPLEKFPTTLDYTGNMSAASVPVLLDQLVREHGLKRGDKIAMSAFGAGLTYGAVVMEW